MDRRRIRIPTKAKLPLLILLTLVAGVVFAFVYGGIKYAESERAANRESSRTATVRCLMLGATFLLTDYFGANGHYPAQDAWEAYVVDNWFPPGELGCRPRRVAGVERLVDSMGVSVDYRYISATEVYVYSDALRSGTTRAYHLVGGKLYPTR